ncbi:hypothetical protein FW320_23015 [Azospirillum sp. Vi22]|nr:hypothetical protein [Azospirillum baldaniorum]NUB09041.1 hypothetical protein [Azospirillum baldaniorum]
MVHDAAGAHASSRLGCRLAITRSAAQLGQVGSGNLLLGAERCHRGQGFGDFVTDNTRVCWSIQVPTTACFAAPPTWVPMVSSTPSAHGACPSRSP